MWGAARGMCLGDKIPIQDPGSIAWTWTVAGGAGGERMGARVRCGISWGNVLDLDRYRA